MNAERLIFPSLIEPLGVKEFEQDIRGGREWFGTGSPDRFAHLLSWRSLNELIRYRRPPAPRFRLVKFGRAVPESDYHRTVHTLRGPLRMLDTARLLAEIRKGATMVWDAIDQAHSPIHALKQEIERALRVFAFVNMYASWGDVGGFPEHWDDHDVFVIQLLGQKHWQVQSPTRKWPLPDDFGEPPTEYANEWTLTPGSVLYLPRGWWHKVTPLNQPSLHLTIGVLRPTNADFMTWLVQQATACDLMRQDIPVLDDDQARARHAAALRSVLDEWLAPSALRLFDATQSKTHYLDPRPTLQALDHIGPGTWEADSRVVLLSTRAEIRRRDGGVVLVVAGDEWWAPAQAEPCLRALVEGRPIGVDVFSGHATSSLVSELVASGVAAVI
ncbi:JmjC domain-containing protein [Streptomyces sp. NBC_00425]|uniref:JmjC domain-containing protein n=1 Tax=Streptomyces sp. NBC_00425 TaxID=2975740 RepID=UPI002E226015